MPIFVKCPSCNKRLKAPDTAAGRILACPACKTMLAVPAHAGDSAKRGVNIGIGIGAALALMIGLVFVFSGGGSKQTSAPPAVTDIPATTGSDPLVLGGEPDNKPLSPDLPDSLPSVNVVAAEATGDVPPPSDSLLTEVVHKTDVTGGEDDAPLPVVDNSAADLFRTTFESNFPNIVFPRLAQSNPPTVKHERTPDFIEGEFRLTVNLPLNPTTLVRYMIPLDPDTGRPRESASHVVFYAPYNGDARQIAQGLKPWHRYFVEESGFSMFTLTIEANTEIVNDKNQYYIYKEAKWFELVFAIKAHLEKEFALTERPLLIAGESSGGSMAQQMVAAYPGKIAAAAWNGGHRYVPFDGPNNVAMLALNNWACHALLHTVMMVREAPSKGNQVLHAQTFPPTRPNGTYEPHGASEFTYSLIQTFIEEVVALADANEGRLPPRSEWPVMLESDDGPLYLPSEAFAAHWHRLPRRTMQKIDGWDRGMIVFPPPDEPKMLVVVATQRGWNGATRLKDALYLLNQQQMASAAILMSGSVSRDISHFSNLLDKAIQAEEWEHLPIVIYGEGYAGQLAAVAGMRAADRRITGIIILDPPDPMRTTSSTLSITGERNPARIPLKLYFTGAIPPRMPKRNDMTVSQLARMNKDLAQVNVLRELVPKAPVRRR
jgi:hypothetical protein